MPRPQAREAEERRVQPPFLLSAVGRRLSAPLLMLLLARPVLAASPTIPDQLVPAPTRDQKIVRRWSVAGDPRGIAVGADGTIYVGLAQSQSVIAVDPKSGAVTKKVVLDSAEIAATKELVTLRTNADGTRLYIANGSDESATILSLPDLAVVREITIEGESIRDALPDPLGRYVYLLGRRVHVFDAAGEKELHTLPFAEPGAIAAGPKHLAVIGSNDFGNAKATAVALYDTTTFRELARDPLETADAVVGALFSPDESTILAISPAHLFERPVVRSAKTMTRGADGQLRMSADFGDFTNSNTLCMPEGAGPQIFALAPDNSVVYAERRCSTAGSFVGSRRHVNPVSLYGIAAYAIALDPSTKTIAATDRSGYLTIYRMPVRDPKSAR